MTCEHVWEMGRAGALACGACGMPKAEHTLAALGKKQKADAATIKELRARVAALEERGGVALLDGLLDHEAHVITRLVEAMRERRAMPPGSYVAIERVHLAEYETSAAREYVITGRKTEAVQRLAIAAWQLAHAVDELENR
jgi:hypothetical protein